MSDTLSKRLARLERRNQPDPAPVRFVVVTRDDEGGSGGDDQHSGHGPAYWFTIRIDRANGGEAADA